MSKPTPETDAYITSQSYSPTEHQWRCFARKLERERDEAREALRKAIRFVEAYEPHSRGVEADQNETISIMLKALEETK